MKLKRVFWFFWILFFGKYERVELSPTHLAERFVWKDRAITLQVWRKDELK